MALDPEMLRRRQRIKTPRAPSRTLGARGSPKEADEKLENLLEQLLEEAKKDTLFTMTTEYERLLSALLYAGYLAPVMVAIENQLAPGATATTYLPVLPGFVFMPTLVDYYTSLPWWISAAVWFDTDVPALPLLALVRAPDHYIIPFRHIMSMTRFLRYTVTNNHATDTANFCGIHAFAVVTSATWRMLEIVYFKPLVDYIRDKAEELSGRPWP